MESETKVKTRQEKQPCVSPERLLEGKMAAENFPACPTRCRKSPGGVVFCASGCAAT